MKLLFDTQIFDWQINGGISRYFMELITRLDVDEDLEVIFNCKHSYNTYIQNTKWLKTSPKLTNVDFKGKLGLVKIANQLVNRQFSNRYLINAKQDLFHPTYYDPYFLKKIGIKPFVLTVYDLTIENYFDGSALTKKVLAWKKELINKASHIIAISENTKNDIVSFYNVAPSKITTIYLAGGFDAISRNDMTTISPPVKKNYLLFVGSRSKYKNFTGFLPEVAPLLNKYDLDLVITGGGQLTQTEIALLKSLNVHDRTTTFNYISDDRLIQLYKNAMVFIFPSLYEGFGIPVLEAMQCECPALLSNNSSLAEVGQTAAQYFDPLIKGDLKICLEKLILDETLRGQMKADGLLQAQKFSWDITAAKHAEVYLSI